MIQLLAERYRVLAIHHRPLWPGSHPEDIDSWQIIAEDIIHLFEQEGLKNAIGVGHSLGAVATMMAAIQQPELFRALVLIEPVFLPPSISKILAELAESGQSQRIPFVPIAQRRRNRWATRQEAFEHFRPKRVFRQFGDDALWDYVRYGLRVNETGQLELSYRPAWEARIYELQASNVWQLIPRIEQPTLGLRGSETDTLFPEAWELWQENQPEATFIEIPESGHLVPMEKPVEAARLIMRFLDDKVQSENGPASTHR